MKNLKLNATLVAMSLILSNVALAASPVAGQPDDSDDTGEQYFDGFYGGASIGYDKITATINHQDGHDSSLSVEGVIGYRIQFDNDWVIGIEGSLGDRQGDLSQQNVQVSFGRIWGLAATVGWSFGQQKDNLIYGKLGVAGIDVDVKAHGNYVGGQNFEGPVSTLGYERVLTDNISLRMEVSYSSFDDGLDYWQPKLGALVRF